MDNKETAVGNLTDRRTSSIWASKDAQVSQDVSERIKRFDSLAAQYGDLPSVPKLSDLPLLTKRDFVTARSDIIRLSKSASFGSILLGSGGTTSTPKLSAIPLGMYLAEIMKQWSPLTPDDVVVNANQGGELGSMFPFFAELCRLSKAVHVPLGALGDSVVDGWLDFMAEIGVTALAGTPTQLAAILVRFEQTERTIPTLTKLLWTGEGFNEDTQRVVRRHEELELWGVYGSTETWVIGSSGPSCPIGTLHPLPYNLLESIDQALVVTSLHPECVNPVVRYRVGDKVSEAKCDCPSPIPAFRVDGRSDDQLKFLSILFEPSEPHSAVISHPFVDAAQVILRDLGTPQESMQIEVTGKPDDLDPRSYESEVREHFLSSMYRLAHEVHSRPDRLVVKSVRSLQVNARTMKTPLIRLEASA